MTVHADHAVHRVLTNAHGPRPSGGASDTHWNAAGKRALHGLACTRHRAHVAGNARPSRRPPRPGITHRERDKGIWLTVQLHVCRDLVADPLGRRRLARRGRAGYASLDLFGRPPGSHPGRRLSVA